MKILYIYNSLTIWGGVERVLVDKMNYLSSQHGYDVYIITYNQGEHEIPYKLNKEVNHIDLDVRTHKKYEYKGLQRIWKGFVLHKLLTQRLDETIQNIAPDIIVTTTTGEISLLLKLKRRIPLIIESHGGYDHLIDYPYESLWHKINIYLLRKRLHKVDAIISLTENDANKWRNEYKNVHVIPNIVHLNITNVFSTCIEKRVIFVGRLAKQKGLPELFSIWSAVHEKHPEWELDIYGEGDFKSLLRNDKSLQGKNINFFDPVSDIHSRFIKSSILILTSEYEPFGLVIPEAMSCGLPVISFEGDGPCSIITEGKDGFIINNRSVKDFVDKLSYLMDNLKMRQHMGDTAIKSSLRYKADFIMPKWLELFNGFNL